MTTAELRVLRYLMVLVIAVAALLVGMIIYAAVLHPWVVIPTVVGTVALIAPLIMMGRRT